MSTLKCNIVSAEEEIFSGTAKMVVATGEMGELGITPRHAQLITRLKPGQVRVIKEDDEEEFLYVSGGILEVQPHLVTILADTAVRAHDLDEAAALKAKESLTESANRVVQFDAPTEEVAAESIEIEGHMSQPMPGALR